MGHNAQIWYRGSQNSEPSMTVRQEEWELCGWIILTNKLKTILYPLEFMTILVHESRQQRQ